MREHRMARPLRSRCLFTSNRVAAYRVAATAYLSRRVGDFSCSFLAGGFYPPFSCVGSGIWRFSPRARSPRPGMFTLASVTSSIVPNGIRVYPPSRPVRFVLFVHFPGIVCRSSLCLLPPVDSCLSFSCFLFSSISLESHSANLSANLGGIPPSVLSIPSECFSDIFRRKINFYLHISKICCTFALENLRWRDMSLRLGWIFRHINSVY